MANEYIAKDYLGAVAATTLTTAVSGSALSLVVASGTTYPDGTNGPFVVVLDRGTGTEEKVICSSRSGNTLTVLQRAYDGTTGQAHSIGATVEHCLDAYSIKQANVLANVQTTRGDLIVRNASGNPARLPVGAAGTVLKGGTDPSYGAVTAAELDATVAGNGLAGGAGTALSVNVDGTTLEINADALRVKDGGLAAAKLASATSAQLLVANASGVPTWRTVTGDVTIDNLGATAIAAGVIVNNDVNAAAAIAYTKLALAASIKNADLATTSGELGGAWGSGTLTGFTNATGGAGTYTYFRMGKLVALQINITAGTATAAGVVTFSLSGSPFTTTAVKQGLSASADAAGLAVQGARIDASSNTIRIGGPGIAALALGANLGSQIAGVFEVA